MRPAAGWWVLVAVTLAACAQTVQSGDAGPLSDSGSDDGLRPALDAPNVEDGGASDAPRDLAPLDAARADSAEAPDGAGADVVVDAPSEAALDARDEVDDRVEVGVSDVSPEDARDATMDVSIDGAGACPGADLRRDPSNCGGCGVRCCGGWCFDGRCGTEGPPGTSGCPSHRTDCVGPEPVQVVTDARNCGACGVACPTGTFCSAGRCVCADGHPVCDGACTDARIDPRNCGYCGHACCAGEACTAGACVATCAAGMSSCPRPTGGCQTCADLASDPANCGACSNACPAGWACASGRCAAPPRDGGCPASGDAGAADGGTCCAGEAVNVGAAPDTSTVQGVAWAAYDQVPACSYDVARLEIHTRGGEVALLEDACGEPGRLLFRGTVTGSGDIGWKGADVTPPVHVVAGRRYWVATHVTIASFAGGGVLQAQRGAPDLAGPWDGPYHVHAFTFRATGRCP